MSSTIWYTERQASGVWPYPFIDVTAKTSQHGPSLDVIFTACAANQGGDLHVLASDVAGKLWHTILLANGNWPFPFGDLQVAANSTASSGILSVKLVASGPPHSKTCRQRPANMAQTLAQLIGWHVQPIRRVISMC
jgi:hypothetical protein